MFNYRGHQYNILWTAFNRNVTTYLSPFRNQHVYHIAIPERHYWFNNLCVWCLTSSFVSSRLLLILSLTKSEPGRDCRCLTVPTFFSSVPSVAKSSTKSLRRRALEILAQTFWQGRSIALVDGEFRFGSTRSIAALWFLDHIYGSSWYKSHRYRLSMYTSTFSTRTRRNDILCFYVSCRESNFRFLCCHKACARKLCTLALLQRHVPFENDRPSCPAQWTRNLILLLQVVPIVVESCNGAACEYLDYGRAS